jgi:hypothetical protein
MIKAALAFGLGLLFGLGVVTAGMSNPVKVQNFFDIADVWDRFDPSLALVMAAGLLVTIPGYRLIFARRAPVLDAGFHLPERRFVDLRLLAGAAIFGVGWGLSGFCPGGVLPALALGRYEPLVFAAALGAGMLAAVLALRAVNGAGTVGVDREQGDRIRPGA